MSDTTLDDSNCTARHTESMDQLAAFLETVTDCAVQVDDALHDVTSRASQLDVMSDDVLDVIDDSSRHGEAFAKVALKYNVKYSLNL